MSTYVLYRITNILNNREYVGVTDNFNRRMYEHYKSTSNSAINPDIKLYGEDKFRKEILCIGNKKYILDMEFKYLDKYMIVNNMYNKNRGGSLNGGTYGENHGSAKLTNEDIINIRRLYSEDNSLTYNKLAIIYNVTESTIGKIIRHNTWTHIKDCRYTKASTTKLNTPRDKISLEDASLIRELYSTGKYTYQDISDLLDNIISKTAVGKIIRNERWK